MILVSWNVEDARRCIDALPAIHRALGTPDVLCLQELRLRAEDATGLAALQRALPGFRCHCSLPRDRHNVKFRGGRMYGVATFVRGRWWAEVPEWDLEGRIIVVRRAGIAIANVYAVNGTDKPYFGRTGSIIGDRHGFKRAFQAKVFDLGRELKREGSVILAGDWNVSRAAHDTHPRLRTEPPHARARAELNDRLIEDGFVDIWRQRHATERVYTWFNRRARGLDAARVDYVLVSTDLVPRVRRAEILPRLPWSDHAPVALEV